MFNHALRVTHLNDPTRLNAPFTPTSYSLPDVLLFSVAHALEPWGGEEGGILLKHLLLRPQCMLMSYSRRASPRL